MFKAGAGAVRTNNDFATATNNGDYSVDLTFDLNGNIETLNRNGTTAISQAMDLMTYSYQPNTNKLLSVNDQALDNSGYNDIKQGMAANNYTYDDIGQLIEDKAEEIDEIVWNVQNKVREVKRSTGSVKPDLEFIYDPAGTRLAKIVKHHDQSGNLKPQNEWGFTYYVRDATGNIMATYAKEEANTTAAQEVLYVTERMIYGSKRLGNFNQKTDASSKVGAAIVELSGDNASCSPYDVQITIDGLNIHAAQQWTGATNTATNVATSITNTTTTPNYTAIVDPGNSQRIIISADDCPDVGKVVTVSETQACNFTLTVIQDLGLCPDENQERLLGEKAYECSNHLGNVLSVVSDRKLAVNSVPSPGDVDHYTADVLSFSDYYPFGMLMPGRNGGGEHRFGFNGMEQDQEFKGDGNSYTTEFRQFDPRLGKWLSIDPLAAEFPWQSPYVALDNNPVLLIDPKGLSASGPGGTCIGCPESAEEGQQHYGLLSTGRMNAGTHFYYHKGGSMGKAGWYTETDYKDIVSRTGQWFGEKDWSPKFSDFTDLKYLSEDELDYLGERLLRNFDADEDWIKEYGPVFLGGYAIGRQVASSHYHFMRSGTAYSVPIFQEILSLGGYSIGKKFLQASISRLAVKKGAPMVADKASSQGGLNLFKWGAPQTSKETGWKTGDYFLHLPNKGTPKLNWKANYGELRREMGLGKPIFDSYRLPNGNLIPTGGFLNAERYILQSRGWIYSPSKGAWLPPG